MFFAGVDPKEILLTRALLIGNSYKEELSEKTVLNLRNIRIRIKVCREEKSPPSWLTGSRFSVPSHTIDFLYF